jgi:predicted RNase H-like HicB family nuclease
MPRYEIIIYWSQADEAFVAEVPELPGCAADGKTYKEALANVEIIIQEWIETAKELGRHIPAPRGRLAFACGRALIPKNAFGWPILAGLFHARVGPFSSTFF